MGKLRIKHSLLASALLLWLWGGSAQAEPLTVDWSELRADRPSSCSALLENYLTQPKCTQQAASARLLSRQYEKCAPGSAGLDGKTVRIAGYAHPLEFQFKDVKEFLLIPPLRQDCTHPPPPLPDQVISVRFPDGLDVNADPVWVTGVLRRERAKTHLATANYTLQATSVTQATIPEVSPTN
ncbi:DUF3299 domain-containing protein [Roseibium sp.]|uniref:DUF3299 domain-containing protein n=1 Tax=Roseibium sp. TaxID=1936156 RepID=UPI003B507D02